MEDCRLCGCDPECFGLPHADHKTVQYFNVTWLIGIFFLHSSSLFKCKTWFKTGFFSNRFCRRYVWSWVAPNRILNRMSSIPYLRFEYDQVKDDMTNGLTVVLLKGFTIEIFNRINVIVNSWFITINHTFLPILNVPWFIFVPLFFFLTLTRLSTWKSGLACFVQMFFLLKTLPYTVVFNLI